MIVSPITPHITVCICTCQREQLLARLLRELSVQRTDQKFTFSIVIADNDAGRSAEGIAQRFAETSGIPVIYCCEPVRNIARVRNLSLKASTGDFIAFIDDDEFPEPDWLLSLWRTCEHHQVSGALGPVRPHFDHQPPTWVLRGKICNRPEHPNGWRLEGKECRTGNALIRRAIVADDQQPFDCSFGRGGEDRDFFSKKIDEGYKFVWARYAIVHEVVPPARCSRSYFLRRALLRGQISVRHRDSDWKLIIKSILAIPVYSLAVPFAFAAGGHCFMSNCIKLCDHLGRILTLLMINPVSERDM